MTIKFLNPFKYFSANCQIKVHFFRIVHTGRGPGLGGGHSSEAGAADEAPLAAIVLLLLLIHHLQALADQSDLLLHVDHGLLHAPHLLLKCNGNRAMALTLLLVLQTQLLVAVVLCPCALTKQHSTAHLAGLTPMLTVASVGLQVTAQQLGTAPTIRAPHQLKHAAQAVAVLLGQWKSGTATTDLILAL